MLNNALLEFDVDNYKQFKTQHLKFKIQHLKFQ